MNKARNLGVGSCELRVDRLPTRNSQLSTKFEIVLTLRDAGGPADAPLAVRLRLALKRLLRSFGLRVVRIERKKTD
jgi:hypothetical protein